MENAHSRKNHKALGLGLSVGLIIALVVIVYSNSLGGEFVWDDESFIVGNPAIKQLTVRSVAHFLLSPTAIASGILTEEVYRPLTALSYAIDFSVWRFDPFGYHLMNVVIHAVNAVLVLVFLALLFGDPRPALFGALAFAVHPVQTEAVAWISGRSNLLCTLFFLASFIAYSVFSERRTIRYYIVSLALFVPALLTREMAAALPIVIVAYDAIYRGIRETYRRWLVYIPYIVLTLMYMWWRTHLLGRLGQTGWWGDPYTTFLTMTRMVMRYLGLLVFPVRLSAHYWVNISKSIREPAVIFSLAGIAALVWIGVWFAKREKAVSFGIFWFLANLLPVSNVIPIKALIAERFLYLPSVGFCIVLGVFVFRLSGLDGQKGRRRIVALGIFCALIVAYAVRTYGRNADWADTITISQKTADSSPNDPWPLTSLGSYYIEKGEYDKALRSLEQALRLSDEFYLTHSNLGSVYLLQKKYADAIRHHREAVRLNPRLPRLYNGLGIAYAENGDYDLAAEAFRKALEIDKRDIDARLNLGRLSERLENDQDALDQYQTIIAEYPDDDYTLSIAYLRMGDLYGRTGRKAEAAASYRKSISVSERLFEGIQKIARERLRSLGSR